MINLTSLHLPHGVEKYAIQHANPTAPWARCWLTLLVRLKVFVISLRSGCCLSKESGFRNSWLVCKQDWAKLSNTDKQCPVLQVLACCEWAQQQICLWFDSFKFQHVSTHEPHFTLHHGTSKAAGQLLDLVQVHIKDESTGRLPTAGIIAIS